MGPDLLVGVYMRHDQICVLKETTAVNLLFFWYINQTTPLLKIPHFALIINSKILTMAC